MAGLHLPSDMVLAYKQYKQDTETVAGWLAEKAAGCGYKPSMPSTSEPKLKGRARKLARDAAKQTGTSQPAKRKYAVKTTEFLEMAQQIVKARPKVVLNRSIHVIWQRTIRTRRQFGAWFRAKDATSTLSDEKHSHFATILETALNVLKPCFQPVTKPASAAVPKQESNVTTPLQQVNNMFQHLELEDTSLEEEVMTDKTNSNGHNNGSASAPFRAQIDFDDQETEDEFLFAIWSFLHDVQAVRIYIASTWQLYSTGNLELMQAASVTNLAIDLIRRAEADFESTLQRPSKYPAAEYPTGSLPFIIFKLHLPQANGGMPLDIDPDIPRSIIICGCGICDFVLYVPWAMAKCYVGVLKSSPPTFPTVQNDFAVQVPPFPRCQTYRSERYHAQNPSQKAEAELTEILPHFCMLSLMLRRAFIEDEILHAARHVLENHNVPLWVSLALQVQLDIQRLDSVAHLQTFDDLKKAYAVTTQRYKDHQEWSQSLNCEIWEEGGQAHLASLAEQFGEWVKGSKYGKADCEEVRRRMAEGESLGKAASNSKRVPLLEYFPVTCGTMKTEMQLEWHVLGLRLANYTGHVLLLCHLYNALRIVHPEAPIWPDMELVIRNQGEDKIFIGGRPKTLEEAEKKVLLTLGMSTTSFARDSRGTRFNKSKAAQRELDKAPIARNLFDRWLGQESRKHDEAAYELQQLLFSTKYQQDLQHRLYAAEASASEFAGIRAKVIPLNTKMVRTLANLSQGFMAEMPGFTFDYFSMERTCFEIYRKINKGFFELDQVPDKLSMQDLKINNPVRVTLSLLGSAIRTEAAMQMMRGNNRSANRAIGPRLAQNIKSLIPDSVDSETRDQIDEVLKATKQGNIRESFGKVIDLSKDAAAKKTFGPVMKVINKLAQQKNHDFELRKLRKLVGDTAYGIFLFRHPSLENLYGEGDKESWEDIAIAEGRVQKRTQARADNPISYLMATLFLHQPKVMNGEGKDSHSYCDHGELSQDEYLKLESCLRKESRKEAEESTVKADWENYGEIYGKETHHRKWN